jgi:hypothetical protein
MPQDPTAPGQPRLKTDLKLAVRIHQRYRDQGEAAGLAYAVQLMRQMPHLQDQLYALMPASRAQTIRDEIERVRATKVTRQAADACRAEQEQARAAEAEHARHCALSAGLQTARATGEAIAFLAGLAPVDRDRLATTEERRAAIALRKTSLLKGKVLAALGCTATELERWHADGRLPHLFVRRLTIGEAGKVQECRFWAQEVVTAAQPQTEGWRAQDQVARRRKRQSAAD